MLIQNIVFKPINMASQPVKKQESKLCNGIYSDIYSTIHPKLLYAQFAASYNTKISFKGDIDTELSEAVKSYTTHRIDQLSEKLDNSNGNLYIICGPSGAGKDSVTNGFLKKHPEIVLSTSATTREPRNEEKSGSRYNFKTKEEFLDLAKEEKLLECEEVYGSFYGTLADPIEEALSEGKDVVFLMDIKGAFNIKNHIKEAKLIFIAPPSEQELEARLKKRNSETEEKMKIRLSNAKQEMERMNNCDYVIVNNNLNIAQQELEEIVLNTRENK